MWNPPSDVPGPDDRFQSAAFIGELVTLVHRYRHEFSIPYVNIIGCLEIVAHHLKCEAFEVSRDAGQTEESE